MKRNINVKRYILLLIIPFTVAGTVRAAEIDSAAIQGQPSQEVYAETVNGQTKSYLVKVEWGDMQFVYDYGEPKWDSVTMKYTDTFVEGWQESCLDGINNKVTVINQSNAQVRATLKFEMASGAFNWKVTKDSVVGNFYDTNDNARTAAGILVNTGSTEFTGKVDSLVLETAEPYEKLVINAEGKEESVAVEAGARTASAFFAFSGTPDKSIKGKASVGNMSVIFSNP